jgi:hypothetical protein
MCIISGKHPGSSPQALHPAADNSFRAGAALASHASAKGGTAHSISIDSLKPGTTLKDMSDSEFIELTQHMLDGPGRVHTIMAFLGLTRCKDTMVGNQMLRGISGGERKRLSTAEMLLSSRKVLLLDEISTGLVRPRPLPSSLSCALVRWQTQLSCLLVC